MRDLEARAHDLERLLGRKTLKVEVLKEALTALRDSGPDARHGASQFAHRTGSVSQTLEDLAPRWVAQRREGEERL